MNELPPVCLFSCWEAFRPGPRSHVSPLFADGMVLQREIAAPVWGTAEPARPSP